MRHIIINSYLVFVFSLSSFAMDDHSDLEALFNRRDSENLVDVKQQIQSIGKTSFVTIPETTLKCPNMYFNQEIDGALSPKVIGRGGSKIAIELNERRTALLGVTVMLAKEKEAYDVIRKTGLICQQEPLIEKLEGADKTYEAVLTVSSFSYLTRDNLTTIYDKKSQKSIGKLKIFGDDPVQNFTDKNYNLTLLKPLARDMALWKFIGSPGGIVDSCNLIFHKTKEEGVQCRLFLYDLYDKDALESSNTFQFSTTSFDFSNFMKDCYDTVIFSEILENNKNIWKKNISQEEWDKLLPTFQEETLHKYNKELLNERKELWKELSTLLKNEFHEESSLLIK